MNPLFPNAPSRPTLALSLTLAGLTALIPAPPARAEMGPCVPDAHEGLICGSGRGAARVVEDSLSPDRRFAFAWRDPLGPIEAEPVGDLELVMVRLADGAILAMRPTEYWATGEMRVNRLHEEIAWSPNSRLAVRTFQQRFESGHFEFFARDDGGTKMLDLKKLVEPAVLARLSARQRRAYQWSFAVEDHDLTVSSSGRVHFRVMLWVPKDGPDVTFDVTLQVARGPKGLGAQLVSVRKVKTAE